MKIIKNTHIYIENPIPKKPRIKKKKINQLIQKKRDTDDYKNSIIIITLKLY